MNSKVIQSYWDLATLHEAQEFEVVSDDDGVQGIFYNNEPYDGSPTRVFAYLGIPEGDGPFPGMVCVHGGGGQAFRQWVELWNARGYAAISMDLRGNGPDGERHGHAGPEQKNDNIFDLSIGWLNTWQYHAIAAIARANSLLAAQPSVAGDRIGVTGISWGGYLTCIAAGVDDRFKCAIPVYGCGFLSDNSAEEWMNRFGEMSEDELQQWNACSDPSAYLPNARMPMLFVNGTNDFAYPLDSMKKSVGLVPGPVSTCVRLEMPHGHEPGWEPEEIGRFADHHLRGTAPLPQLGPMTRGGDGVSAAYESSTEVASGWLLHTEDNGRWQERKWRQTAAELTGTHVQAKVPHAARVYYLAVEDADGLFAGTLHEEAG